MNTRFTVHKNHSFPSFTLMLSFFKKSITILQKQKKEIFIILGIVTSIVTTLFLVMLFSWFIPVIKYLLSLLGTTPLDDIPKSWILGTLFFCAIIYCVLSCFMLLIKNIFLTVSLNYNNDPQSSSYQKVVRFSLKRLLKTLLVRLTLFCLLAAFILFTGYIAYRSSQPYIYFKDMSVMLLGDSLLISSKSLILFCSISFIGLLMAIGISSFFQLAEMLAVLYDIGIKEALKYSFLLIKNKYKTNLSVYFFSNLINILFVIIMASLLSISVIGLAFIIPLYLFAKIIRYLFFSQIMLYHYTHFIETNIVCINAVNLYKIFFNSFDDNKTIPAGSNKSMEELHACITSES